MKRKLLLLVVFVAFLVSSISAQTVYITKTGAKYHRESCRYLSKSKIAIDLSDAIAKGYGACSVCKPSSSANKDSSSKPNSIQEKQATPNVSQSTSTKSQSSLVQCSATTKAGTRCKRMTRSSNGRCWQHGGN